MLRKSDVLPVQCILQLHNLRRDADDHGVYFTNVAHGGVGVHTLRHEEAATITPVVEIDTLVVGLAAIRVFHPHTSLVLLPRSVSPFSVAPDMVRVCAPVHIMIPCTTIDDSALTLNGLRPSLITDPEPTD